MRGPKLTANTSTVWLTWLLMTGGFVVLLAGVASMQKQCLSSGITSLGVRSSTGYLGAPVSCSHYFQYTWWITALHFFVWALIAAYLLMGILHKTRVALVGLLAVATVLLMDTANTYLLLDYSTDAMGKRVRTTIAGAIICAIANMLLIMLIGFHDDTTERKERGIDHNKYPAGEGAYHTVPVGAGMQTTQTTTTIPTTV